MGPNASGPSGSTRKGGMETIRSRFDRYRAARIASFMAGYIRPRDTVLDFGAGNMTVAQAVERNLHASVVGVDVLPSTNGKLPFSLYDGRRLPFADDVFDEVYLAFVLHHTRCPREALRECLRVSRGVVIILEDVYRTKAGKYLLSLFDWIGNRPFATDMQLTYNFLSDRGWRKLIRDLDADEVEIRSIRPTPWRPTRHRMYVMK